MKNSYWVNWVLVRSFIVGGKINTDVKAYFQSEKT